jgi:hypothetical protein
MNVALSSAMVPPCCQKEAPPWLPPPNLLSEDFKTGTIPSGWTTYFGSPNWGYQPSIYGRNSLGCVNLNDQVYATIPAQSSLYVHFRCNILGNNDTASIPIFRLWDEAGVQALAVSWLYYNKLLMINDTGDVHEASTVTGVTPNDPFWCWVRYTAGTGANASMSVAFNFGNDAVEPTSGNQFASMANGASTISATRVWFESTKPQNVIIGHVGVSTVSMPNGW